MPLYLSLLPAALLLVAALSGSCHPQGQAAASASGVTLADTFRPAIAHPRDALIRSVRAQRRLLVVYDSPDSLTRAAYRQQLTTLAAEMRYLDLRIAAPAEVDSATWTSWPLFLVGTPATWPILQAESLPVHWPPDGLRLGSVVLSEAGLSCQVSFVPHPARPQQSLSYLSAPHDSSILAHLERSAGRHLWRDRWAYQVFGGGQRLIMGDLDAQGQPDPGRCWDLRPPRAPSWQSPHLHVYAHDLPASAASRWAAALDSLHTQRPPAPGTPPLVCHLYGSAEGMGLLTQRMETDFVDTLTGAVHLLDQPGLPTYAPAALAQGYLRTQLGPAALPALAEGLAITLTPGWQRRGYAHWAGRLYAAGYTLPLTTLCDPEAYAAESGLVRGALAGALVTFLRQRWGQAALMDRYPTWTGGQLDTLEPAWQNWLAGLARTQPPAPRRFLPPTHWAAGMTLAHEGYNVVDGYGGQAIGGVLDRLQGLGTNSIALVPYTGSRETRRPQPFRIWDQAGGENDLALLNSYYLARKRGMRTLLKPQIWFPQAWPGALVMENEADWAAFFQHYRRWITHYALLAEIHEMDLFCVGVEFVQATRQQPAAWRVLIEDLRSLYRGPITYAANWGEEVENLHFADALDYVGVNCYYPLGKEETLSEAELEAGVARVMQTLGQLAAAYDRPLLFTEVGFRSIVAPWQAPHAEAGTQAYAGIDQRRCYAAMLEAMAAAPWCQGTYWWKWPSYPAYAAQNPRGFTPFDKPAEAVLGRWYRELARD